MASPKFYTLSNNNETITFVNDGLYLVSVNVCARNTTNGNYISMRIGGTDISRCYFADANNFYKSYNLSELISITARQTLDIHVLASLGTHTDSYANRLSIIPLRK